MQDDLNSATLVEHVCSLITDTARLAEMSEGARKLAMPGAADSVVDALLKLAASH
jgi:UDP-N-acetylglucosamine:LPS N-acetylglucosamine transferase